MGRVKIDILPEELLKGVFDFCVCGVDNREKWVTLVPVGRRWQFIVSLAHVAPIYGFSAQARTPANAMLDIWPTLPIAIRVVYYRYGTTALLPLSRSMDHI